MSTSEISPCSPSVHLTAQPARSAEASANIGAARFELMRMIRVITPFAGHGVPSSASSTHQGHGRALMKYAPPRRNRASRACRSGQDRLVHDLLPTIIKAIGATAQSPHSYCPLGRRPVGIANRTALPLCNPLSIHTRPPWVSTIPLTIGRPSPAPLRFFERPCQKRSKTNG